jgi:cytochrome c551/c552
VSDLEASRRFAEPPAAKLLAGYHLVRQLGCFGCHEISGRDTSGRSVGPEMRLEQEAPFAEMASASTGRKITSRFAAAELKPEAQAKGPRSTDLACASGFDGGGRSQATREDIFRPAPSGRQAGPMLKVGPSLRHLAEKTTAAYVADRLRDPAHFLPDTRMPRIYGLDEQLRGKSLAMARRFEPVEIRAIVEYLLAKSEPISPLPGPPDVAAAPSVERGKQRFERQGCLACHQHRDLPQSTATQGPELSRMGAKYRPGSGARWLTGWIRDPAHYRPRTTMPTMQFDEGGKASEGAAAADIAAYLLAVAGTQEKPAADSLGGGDARDLAALADALGAKKELLDVGRQAIARRGCFGCHDIPGFEDARPIGPVLSDWGRKQESLLGFERVEELAASSTAGDAFYLDALRSHRREGFLWQKLRAPRSFDFAIAETKGYPQWLTMGQFRLSGPQREAVMTFVLGLVAEPAAEKYVCREEGRRGVMAEGRQVLDKYACAECHTLELERWTFAARGQSRVEVAGMPRVDAAGKRVEDEDDAGQPLYYFTPWEPALIDGRVWPVGSGDVPVVRGQLLTQRPPWGGTLARLLYPRLLAQARVEGAAGVDSTAWGRLPPPLVHEGTKVQAAWLRQFLLDPVPIRPATVLRMPRFNFSATEVTKLVAYFAAAEDDPAEDFPRGLSQFSSVVSSGDAENGTVPFAKERGEDPGRFARMAAAMRILTDQKTYCGRCHQLGDNQAEKGGRAIVAPDLEEVGHRLQPAYLRRWLANPKSILPYTAMPVNFPPAGPPLMAIPGLGTSREQFDAVIDLLIHYDWYLRRKDKG